jgi:hypothetical protein
MSGMRVEFDLFIKMEKGVTSSHTRQGRQCLPIYLGNFNINRTIVLRQWFSKFGPCAVATALPSDLERQTLGSHCRIAG